MLLLISKGGRKGGVLVMVALSIVVLFAMAALSIDIGQMYAAKQRAQNVCDAGVMAGARFFDPGKLSATAQATASANECALANNGEATWKVKIPGSGTQGLSVSFPAGKGIRTDAEITITPLFAGILGFGPKPVRAHSVARLSEVASLSYPCLPLAVSDKQIRSLSFGDPETLRTDKWKEGLDVYVGPGNFGTLAFSGDSGSADFTDRISGDRSTSVFLKVGDAASTEPGNMLGPTYKGFTDRVRKDSVFTDDETAWSAWLAGWDSTTATFPPSPRIVVLPVMRDVDGGAHGRATVELVGFAGFFLESISRQKSRDAEGKPEEYAQVTGRFLSGIVENGTIRWLWSMDSASTGNTIVERRLVE